MLNAFMQYKMSSMIRGLCLKKFSWLLQVHKSSILSLISGVWQSCGGKAVKGKAGNKLNLNSAEIFSTQKISGQYETKKGLKRNS